MDLQTMKTQMNTVIQKHQVSKVFIYVFLAIFCGYVYSSLVLLEREMNTETNKKKCGKSSYIYRFVQKIIFMFLNESFFVFFHI